MIAGAPSATTAERRPLALELAAFGAIYFLWGATFLALRYAVAEIPPLATMAIRCAGGATILFLWCGTRGELERPTREQWRVAALAGVLLFLGCHAALAHAEQRVSSGQAALLLTSIPLWLVLLEARARRRLPAPRVFAGLLLGIAGVFVLVGSRTDGADSWSDRALLVLAALAWAAGSLVARDGPRPASAVQSTAMQLAVGAVALSLGAAALGELDAWTAPPSRRALLALAFLVVCGTTIAFAAYTWLLRVASAAAVGSYAFVNPLIAVGLAWAAGDEPVRLRTIVAAGLVVPAVVLVRGPFERSEE